MGAGETILFAVAYIGGCLISAYWFGYFDEIFERDDGAFPTIFGWPVIWPAFALVGSIIGLIHLAGKLYDAGRELGRRK